MTTRGYMGRFRPKNRHKYIGDPDNIIYRSSWECKAMSRFDLSEKVLKWASEEISIPYISPMDNDWHRYFPDFFVLLDTEQGPRGVVIEVKPDSQTKPPKQQKRMTKRYLREVMTYGVNDAKWKAAREFCKNRNWDFRIMTEHDLNIK